MIELSDEQRLRLENGNAVDVTDSATAMRYVVIAPGTYERIKTLLYDDSQATDDDLRELLGRSSLANGWDEPGMDAYDRYDEELAKRCP